MINVEAKEEPKMSLEGRGGVDDAAPKREIETETPAAAGALEALNRRFRVNALTAFPVQVKGHLSLISEELKKRRHWARI